MRYSGSNNVDQGPPHLSEGDTIMNIKRFYGLPNALKPVIIVLVILTMILGGAGKVKTMSDGKTPSLDGGWFFWLTMIVQLVWMVAVIGLFLYECETMLTCGREAWPIVEMSYSGAFCVCNVVNTFILASWYKYGANGTFIVAALFAFALFLFYGLGGIMMFRIWRGFVRSGASQNPTPNVQPGNIGGMNPGV